MPRKVKIVIRAASRRQKKGPYTLFQILRRMGEGVLNGWQAKYGKGLNPQLDVIEPWQNPGNYIISIKLNYYILQIQLISDKLNYNIIIRTIWTKGISSSNTWINFEFITKSNGIVLYRISNIIFKGCHITYIFIRYGIP